MVRWARVAVILSLLVGAAAGATPDDAGARLQRARAASVAGHCNEAVPLLEEIVTNRPGDPAALPAASLLFDCLARQRRTEELGRRVDQLCAVDQLRRDAGFAELCGRLRVALDRVRAEELGQAGRYEEAAAAYLAIAARRRDDPGYAELLYNAAISYERAGRRDQALKPLRALVAWDDGRAQRGARPHPLALHALKRLGDISLSLASYADAAGYLERFAERDKTTRQAREALLTAAALHVDLGDDRRALRGVRAFARYFSPGVGERGRLAQAHFAVGAIFERREATAKVADHYREYLEQWGAFGRRELKLAAHAKIAAALWRQSCPVPGVDGLCVSVVRPTPAGPPACGEATGRIRVHERRPALVREARAHLVSAIGMWLHPPGAARGPDASMAVAHARFLQADAQYERLLAARWLEARAPAADIDAVTVRYQEVSHIQEPSWAFAALARMGQINATVADRLRVLPRGVKSGPRRDAFCRAAETAAAPFMAESRQRFTRCLQLADELRYYGEWHAACARGIDEKAPADIAPHPGFVTPAISMAPAVLEERRQGPR